MITLRRAAVHEALGTQNRMLAAARYQTAVQQGQLIAPAEQAERDRQERWRSLFDLQTICPN